MNISAAFIRRPIATSLLTAGILMAGAVAYRLLPVAPLPQVEFPTIQVQASLPGASPETMASSVATPLERQFGRIASVTEMTSASWAGSTSVTLQFDLNRNIDAAARDVQAAYQRVIRPVAREPSEPADLQKDQSCRFADSGGWRCVPTCCRSAVCTTWPIRSSGRNCRRFPAWGRCRSVAARVPPCASR